MHPTLLSLFADDHSDILSILLVYHLRLPTCGLTGVDSLLLLIHTCRAEAPPLSEFALPMRQIDYSDWLSAGNI